MPVNQSTPLKCLPYGADPNPKATKRLRPPCLDCPTFKVRQQRARLKTVEPVSMISECRQCKTRLEYADAMDPSRHRYVPKGREAQRLDEGKVSGYRVTQGAGFYELLDKRAAGFGWPDGVGLAIVDLKETEGCSYRTIAKLFGISPNLASKLYKKQKGEK